MIEHDKMSLTESYRIQLRVDFAKSEDSQA